MASLDKKPIRFKPQQDRHQASLVSTAAVRAASSKTAQSQKKTQANAYLIPSTGLTPLKFSNDIEKLRYINNVRDSAANSQVKRVISLLQETRQALTAEQIYEACYVNLDGNDEVLSRLTKNNCKVKYDGRHFSYKATHDLKDKNQLLELIQNHRDGVAVTDLEDAYPSVMEDLLALKASGQIWVLSNCDSRTNIAYPNYQKVQIKVDEDLKQLFQEIELPREMVDLEKHLEKNGMKPATNTARRKQMAQASNVSPSKPKAKKKREFSKRTKLTNAHLPELFKNLNAPGT